jgi:HSP20 family protein
MAELFSRAFGEREETGVWTELLPLDLSETDQTFEVRLDVPGVNPKEIDIQLNANMLTISGERSEEKEEKGKTYHFVERSFGSFSRSVSLPSPVKEDAIEARYKDGVLTVTLPKTEEAKSRKIAITA